MAKVRHATPADIDVMVAMGRALHAESPRYAAKRFDEAKVRHLAARMLSLPDVAVVFVAEVDGHVVGMMGGTLSEYWFGPDRFASDVTLYVRPKHRGGGAFLRLVQAFEAWAAERGAGEVDNGVSTDIHADRTVCAYQRLGYTLSPTRIVYKTLHHGN